MSDDRSGDDKRPPVATRSPADGDPWQALRAHNTARIALGRSGGSLPTTAMLDFALAHARARDAVHATFDDEGLTRALTADGFGSVSVASRAATRAIYLRRPDLGRRLDDASATRLRSIAGDPPDIVFVIGDGLSTQAVHAHSMPVLRIARSVFSRWGWTIGPVVVASQSRVALGDEIGECLNARQVVVLIGERPGLSAADSLGIYLTWAPQVGLTDERRNCISNIRPGGLSPAQAVHTLAFLAGEAARRRSTGIDLKDESDRVPSLVQATDLTPITSDQAALRAT